MENALISKVNILVVDDDLLIAESNKFLLKKSGYHTVGIATDGLQAVKLAKEKQPDLILMDVNLSSSMDGITAAEEIQKFADIPFIFLTAYSDPATIERAKKVGPFGYLIKPFDNRELIVAIETSLYKHSFDKKIKEQELLFRTVANFAYEWEFWLLPDLQFKYCSPSCKRITGYNADEFTANPKLLFDVVHPEDRDAFEEHIKCNYPERKEEIITDFQFRIIDKQGAVKFISHTCSAIFDDKKNYLGKRGTNVDITERKRAEETLRQSEETFRELYEQSPVGYQSLDDEGRFITVNDVWMNILGYPKEEVLGKWFGDFLAPEYVEPFRERFPLFKAEGKIHSEFYMMRKNGERAYIAFEGRIGYKPNGEFKQTHCVLSDQTERKLFEESLKKQKEEFETIFNLVPAQIWYKDVHNNFIKVNRQVCEDIGLHDNEINGRPAEELFPSFAKQYYEDDLEVINSGKPKLGISEQVNTASGELRWVHTDKVPVFGKDGKVNGLIAFTQDITEQKQAEEALLESEKNFRLLFESSPMGIYVAKANGDIVNVNSALLLILNSPSIEATKQINVLKFPPLVDNGYAAKFVQCVEQNKPTSFEIEYTSKWGKTAVLSSYLIPLTDDYGKVVNVYTIMEDITERKNAEKALRENEEKFRAIFEQSGDHAFILEPTPSGNLKILDANSDAVRAHGYSHEELINMSISDIAPSAKSDITRAHIELLMSGDTIHFETNHKRKDGSLFPVEITAKAVKIADKPLMIISTERDITERKLAENALHESLERLHIVMNSAPITIFATDSQGIFTLHEGKALKKLGMKPGHNVGMSAFELFSNLPIAESNGIMTTGENVIRRVFAGETVTGLTELNGVYFDNQFAPIQSLDGNVIGLVGVATDITENKKAEKALAASEAKYRLLFDASPVGIGMADLNGNILTSNNVMEQITGYNFEKEKNITALDTYANKEERQKLLAELSANGKVRDWEVELKRKDGSNYYALLNVDFITLGESKYILTNLRDITEHKKAEIALRENKERWESLFNNSPNAIAVYQAVDDGNDFVFTDFNLTAQTTENLNRDEVVGKRISQLFPGAEGLGFLEIFRKVWQTGKTEYIKSSFYKDNRIEGWRENIIYKLNTGEIVAIYNDVTERMEAEIALRTSEERMRLIIEGTSFFFFYTQDADGYITYISPTVEKITGHTINEWMGQRHWFATDNPINLEAPKITQRHLRGEIITEPVYFELRHKNGSTILLEMFENPVFKDGNVVGLQGIVRDITERKHAEEALHESEERYLTLTNTSLDGFWLTDRNVNFLEVNDAYCRMIGYSRDEMLKMNIRDIEANEKPWDVQAHLEKIIELGYDRFESRHKHANGAIIDVEVNANYLESQNKFIVFINDITGRKQAERILKEKNTFIQTVLDNLPIGIELNAIDQGTALYFNKKFLEIYGWSAEALKDVANFFQKVYPDENYRNELITRIMTDIQSGDASRMHWEDCIVTHEDGSKHFVNAVNIPLYDQNTMVSTVFDVTAVKEAEITLRESEERFRAIYSVSPHAISISDIETGQLIEINEAYENIFGYKRKDVLGKTSYELGIWVNKDDRIPIVEALQKEGFYNNFEIRFETENGTIIDTLVSGRKILIKNTEYMLTLVNDITHIKNTERAIKESEQKFRSIFENHSAIKLLIDPDTGNIVDANKAAANYYGWTIEELKQMNITQINSLPLEDAIKLMGQIRVNHKSRFEMQHRLKNGTIRDTEIFSSKIEIGEKDYLHAINHDITDRIIAEKKLKQYQNHLEELVDTRTAELDQLNFDLMEQLKKEKEVELLLQDSLAKEKELNNLKNRFISTVSHEFRTPLASIQLSSGLLQRYVVKWPQERMDEHFKRINKSITNLTNLLDGVLTINRADSDKIQFAPKDIDLKNLCESVIDETTPYRLPGHKFDFTYKTKRTTFYLDPNLMHYVLSNLLINAFKYSPNGGEVSLKVSVLRSKLTIVVKDRGIGISAEDLPFLFEPFYRGANVGNVPGSGLGLSIVQKTVEMQNGKIEVRSAKNTGTIFTVGFPIKKEK